MTAARDNSNNEPALVANESVRERGHIQLAGVRSVTERMISSHGSNSNRGEFQASSLEKRTGGLSGRDGAREGGEGRVDATFPRKCAGVIVSVLITCRVAAYRALSATIRWQAGAARALSPSPLLFYFYFPPYSPLHPPEGWAICKIDVPSRCYFNIPWIPSGNICNSNGTWLYMYKVIPRKLARLKSLLNDCASNEELSSNESIVCVVSRGARYGVSISRGFRNSQGHLHFP